MRRLLLLLTAIFSVCLLHAGELGMDDIDYMYGNILPDATSGWVKIVLKEKTLISGIEIYGTSTPDQELWIDVNTGDTWISYTGHREGMTEGQGYYYEFSRPFHLTDTIKIRAQGINLEDFNITDVKLFGYSGIGMSSLAEINRVSGTDNTDMFYFFDNVIDGNIETEWRITDKAYLDPVQRRAFIFLADKVFNQRLYPYSYVKTGEVIFELKNPGEIDFIYIYVNDGLDGDIWFYTETDSIWSEAGTLNKTSPEGWYRIPVEPGTGATQYVKMTITGETANTGGIGEVQIWQKTFDNTCEQLNDGITVVEPDPAGNPAFYFFSGRGKERYSVELDAGGYDEQLMDIVINGKTTASSVCEDINGIKRYIFPVPEQDIFIGHNIISIPPAAHTIEIFGVRLVKSDTYNTEYRQTDNSVGENIITLDQDVYINHIYLEAGEPLIMYVVHDSVETELFGTSINSDIVSYPVNGPAGEIRILSSSGTETGVVIINKSPDARSVVEIEPLYPDVRSIESWMAQADNYYFTARLTDMPTQVMFDGVECQVIGNVFFFPMNLIGLGPGGNRTLEFDITGAGGTHYTKQIDILIEWQFVTFEVYPREEVIFTQEDILHVSGTYCSVSDRVFIRNNDIEVTDITVLPSGPDFEADITLEPGYNIIVLRLVSSLDKILRTITKRVFKYSDNAFLTITSPGDGDMVNTDTITVEGRVYPPMPDLAVEVNGTPAELTGDRFLSVPVNLTEGINEITVEAKIGDIIIAGETMTVTKDSTAPVIQVIGPSAGTIFNYGNVHITAAVIEEGSVWVMINNQPAQIEGDLFSTTLLLEEGIHSIVIIAVDSAGNKSESIIENVMVDVTPPEPFTLLIDPAGWTNSESVSVTCSTTDALSGIDRYEMSIDAGSYTPYSSPLVIPGDGEHPLMVRAIDNAGNIRQAAGSIFIDRTAPLPPEAFRAVSGNDKIHNKWKATDGDVVNYILMRFPGWPDGTTLHEIPATGNAEQEFVDTEGITGDTAYIYTLFAVDRAHNISSPAISDIKIEGVEIVDVSDTRPEDLVLVEYENAAVVIPGDGFPEGPVLKRIVCTEIEKLSGRDNDGDGNIDEYVDSPYVARAQNPIVGPIYDYSVIVDDDGEEKCLPHITYDKPLLGRITYDESAIPSWADEENLDVYYFNDIWCTWIKVEDSIVDPENNQILFSTNHFSSFSVQPTILEDLSPEALRESGVSPMDSAIIHGGVTVTPEGGGVHMESTEFYLPGKNGFDFSLKRLYDSSIARNDSSGLSIAASMGVNFFNPVPEDIPENPGELGSSLKSIGDIADELLNADKFIQSIGEAALSTLQSRFETILKSQGDYAYSMGQGWRLNLPYIRSSNGGVLVRLPGGSFYDITEMDVIRKNDQFFVRDLHLENHTGEDFTFKVTQGRFNTEMSDILKTAFDCVNLGDALDQLGTIISNGQVISDTLAGITAYGSVPYLNDYIQALETKLLTSNISLAGSIDGLIRDIAGMIPDWNVVNAELQLKDGTTYLFNEKGMLDKIIDPTGKQSITATYDTGTGIDTNGWKLISIEDSMGRKLKFGYEDRYVFIGVQKPYITSIELENDPFGRRVDYTIDDAGLGTTGDTITRMFIGFKIFDMPVFPASLLSKAIITAKKERNAADEINRIYCYGYNPEYLFNFGGSAKLNLLSVAADALSMLLCGMPAFSMVTGMDNLTLSADVRFDFVLPVTEINGPGIGRIVVDNKIEGLNYASIQMTDKLFDLIPVSVEGKLRHTDTLVVQQVKKYKDKTAGTPENTSTYLYSFDTTPKGNIYNKKTIVNDGRLRTEFTYSFYEYPGSRLISWSDHVLANLRNNCLIAPVNNIRTYGEEIVKYESNSNTLLERIMYSEYNADYTRLLKKKTVHSTTHYTETLFDYDSWGNVIHTSEVSKSGTRQNQLETFSYYFDPESSTREWGNNALYTPIADPLSLGNPYQSDHNNLELEREEERDGVMEVVPFQRYDLLLGTVTRNYSSASDIPAGTVPSGITPDEYTDGITYINYDSLGRITGKSEYSDKAGMWRQEEYTYDSQEGYCDSITKDFDLSDNQVKHHVITIQHDYTDPGYYTITQSMGVTTPEGENTQTITTQTGIDKAAGNTVWEMDGRGFYTTYLYDGFGRIIKMENPDTTDAAYNPFVDGLDRPDNPGQIIEYSDTKWTSDTHYYTGLISLVRQDIDPGRMAETEFSYNNLGQLAGIATKNHHYTYINDGDGTKSLSLPGQEITSTVTLEYNGYGEVEEIILPYTGTSTRSVSYEYDPLGKVKKVTDNTYSWDVNRDSVNRNYTVSNYDYATNTKTTTDQRGNIIKEYFDMQGRTIQMDLVPEKVYTNGSVSHVQVDSCTYYDGLGNVLVSIDGRGNATYNEYDNLNRLIRTILPPTDSDHGLIEKENDEYREITGIFPCIEYDYTLTGMKKKEITGYVGMDVTDKRVVDFFVDECGRTFATQFLYTPYIPEDTINSTEIHTTDWETFGWETLTWQKGDNPVSVRQLAYYDENGNKIREVNPANTKLKESNLDYYSHDYEYSPRNKLIKESDSVKRSGSTGIVLEVGDETVYQYNDADNPVLMTDPRGYSIEYFYDELNRVILAVKPKHPASAIHPYVWFSYERNNKVKVREDGPDGFIHSYTYNAKGLVLTDNILESPASTEGIYMTTYRYDAAGNVAEIEDNMGNVTQKYYDSLNREQQVFLPDSSSVWTGYDENGNTTYSARGNNSVIEQENWMYYDSYNRLIKTVNAKGSDSEIESSVWYDVFGNKRVVSDAKNRNYYYDYDERGLAVREVNTRGKSSYSGYGVNGNIIFHQNPLGTKVINLYDYKELLSGTVRNNGEIIQWIAYDYDTAGTIRNMTTSENITTTYNYDNNGIYIPDPYGRAVISEVSVNEERVFTTEYSFDSENRITTFKYPHEETITYRYNRMGELLSMPGYLSENIAPRYNENGLLKEVTAVNGVTTAYSYDDVSRLNGIAYANDTVILKNYSLDYDQFGNIREINGGQYTYDELNRLVNAHVKGNFEVDVREKDEVQRAGIAEEDVLGEKSLLFSGEDTEIITLDYGAVSIGVSLGTGDTRKVTRIRLYPDTGLEEEQNLNKENLALFYAFTNGDDDYSIIPFEDWILKKCDGGVLEIRFRKPLECRYIKVHAFCDDRDINNQAVMNRALFRNSRSEIMRVYYIADTRYETYTYDNAGNRLTSSYQLFGEDPHEKTYRYYDDSDLLMWDGTYAYAWDENGNLKAKGTEPLMDGEDFLFINGQVTFSETLGECRDYIYDLFNRLVTIRKSEAGTNNLEERVYYTYDGNHMRVKKMKINQGNPEQSTYYCFSTKGALLFEETTATYTEYIYLESKVFARETGTRTEDAGSISYEQEKTFYYHTNHLGTTTMITDETGSVLWQDEMTPFGESAGEIGIIEDTGLYTGKELDSDSGLYYFNARWYDASTGRFISEDPLKDGPNWYVYCTNNPLSRIDATGLADTDLSPGPGPTPPPPTPAPAKPASTPGPYPPLPNNPPPEKSVPTAPPGQTEPQPIVIKYSEIEPELAKTLRENGFPESEVEKMCKNVVQNKQSNPANLVLEPSFSTARKNTMQERWEVIGREDYYGISFDAGPVGGQIIKGNGSYIFVSNMRDYVILAEYALNVTDQMGINISLGLSELTILGSATLPFGIPDREVLGLFSGDFKGPFIGIPAYSILGVIGEYFEGGEWTGFSLGLSAGKAAPKDFSGAVSVTTNYTLIDYKIKMKDDIIRENLTSDAMIRNPVLGVFQP